MPSPAEPSGLISTDLNLAVERLRAGGLVAIPTETVYGLAADAEQPDAVARVFTVKGRPADHPLIVHVGAVQALDGWVEGLSAAAEQLAATCWPGPLTLLLRRGPRVIDAVTGGRPTVAVRVPSHPLTLELLDRFGGGLVAPSANRFGRVSPTTAGHVIDDVGDRLDPARDLVLDGGPCPVGVESTIVDLTQDPPQVLRAGAISARDIERLLAGTGVATPVVDAQGPSRASGMLASHYAPRCDVVLVNDVDEAISAVAANRADGRRAEVLDRTDDLVTAARLLYADLRAADRSGLDALVVVLPPAEGIGHALRDRLVKAAAAASPRRGSTSRDD
jgi:L-threonylcarbamoyladenylate synthase